MTSRFVQSEPGSDPILVQGYFSAPPEAVYRAWTVPDLVMKWFGPTPRCLLAAEIDLRVGGNWRFVMRDDEQACMGFEGEYLAIEPDRRLLISWMKFERDASGQTQRTEASQVEILLSAKGRGTDIQIIHSAIKDDATRLGFTGGWEHGMANLRDMLVSVGTASTET